MILREQFSDVRHLSATENLVSRTRSLAQYLPGMWRPHTGCLGLLLVAMVALALPATSAGKPGDLDPSFSHNGYKVVPISHRPGGAALAVSVQTRGRTLLPETRGAISRWSA